jgi:hypothetical protein
VPLAEGALNEGSDVAHCRTPLETPMEAPMGVMWCGASVPATGSTLHRTGR